MAWQPRFEGNPHVEVRLIREGNKGVFAKQDIAAGTTLWSESPVLVQRMSQSCLSCAHCVRWIGRPSPALVLPEVLPAPELIPESEDSIAGLHCERCRRESYCSAECRQEAWLQYHQLLCTGPSADPTHPWLRLEAFRIDGQHLKDIPLADSCEYPKVERAAKLVALKVLQALPSPAGAPPAAPPPLGLVHYPPARYGTPPWYPAVHALVRETLLRNAPALAPDCPLLGFDAFKRALCVWHLNPLRTAQPPRGLPWGRYLRGLRDRDARAGAPDLQAAFGAAWRELGRAPDPEALCCEGQGLYLWHNACNHSCVPSARDRLVRAEGGRLRLQVTALRRLKAGDEVVVAYVGRDLSYAERQARLRYYGFCCVCPKCETERQGLGLPAPVHPEFTCEHDF